MKAKLKTNKKKVQKIESVESIGIQIWTQNRILNKVKYSDMR